MSLDWPQHKCNINSRKPERTRSTAMAANDASNRAQLDISAASCLEAKLEDGSQTRPCAPHSKVLAVSAAVHALKSRPRSSAGNPTYTLLSERYQYLGPQLHRTYSCDVAEHQLASTGLAEVYCLLATLNIGLGLNAECILNALILIERALRAGIRNLTDANVRPLLITAVLLSAKEHYDGAVSPKTIRTILPSLDLAHLPGMEAEFLQLINYGVVFFSKDDETRQFHVDELLKIGLTYQTELQPMAEQVLIFVLDAMAKLWQRLNASRSVRGYTR